MKINYVLEALNEALSSKDMSIWVRDEQIKELKAENEKLKKEIEELKQKKDW